MVEEYFIKTLQNLFEAFHWKHFIKHYLNLLPISEKEIKITCSNASLALSMSLFSSSNCSYGSSEAESAIPRKNQ